MRIAFLFAILAASTYYTYIAYADLNFLSRTGRLGPGFFPRIVGTSMVLLTLWTLMDALRAMRGTEDNSGRWRDLGALMALVLLYAVMLRVFGGFVATVIYLALTLTVINPRKHLQNAILSVVVPIGIYGLFDKLLNASMPPALFDILPI